MAFDHILRRVFGWSSLLASLRLHILGQLSNMPIKATAEHFYYRCLKRMPGGGLEPPTRGFSVIASNIVCHLT